MGVRDIVGTNNWEGDESRGSEIGPIVLRGHDSAVSSTVLIHRLSVMACGTKPRIAYVHSGYLSRWRGENMSGTISPSAGGRNRATQGAVLKYGERLNGALFNFVNSTRNPRCLVNNVA